MFLAVLSSKGRYNTYIKLFQKQARNHILRAPPCPSSPFPAPHILCIPPPRPRAPTFSALHLLHAARSVQTT